MKRLAVVGTLILLIAIVAFFGQHGHQQTGKQFALTIGPRSVVPLPDFKAISLSQEERDSVIAVMVRHEEWFNSLPQALIRYSVDRINHPPIIQQMRSDLVRQFPELEVTEEAFPYLGAKESVSQAIAFDPVRFAFSRESSVDEYCQSMVWDGDVATGVAGPKGKPNNYFLLGSRKECAARSFASFPLIGHAGSKYFGGIFASIADEHPEISVATAFAGRDCLVIETWNDSWIVDRIDHRVWARVGYRRIHLFDNHRQVAPNVLWPQSMTYRSYTKEGDLEVEIVTNIDQFDTGAVPPESAFHQELIAGIEVHDMRHSTPVRFLHDPNRTKEQWKKIDEKIAFNEKRARESEKRRRASIGKPAPDFGPGRWLNSRPLSLQDIRMRGAEIGFVGVACAPCDNILPSFADKVASDQPVKILVFNNRDSDDAIRQKLAPYKVECPVFVPDSSEKHPWGDIYDEFGIQGLPTTVSIDGKCIIRAHNIGMFTDDGS